MNRSGQAGATFPSREAVALCATAFARAYQEWRAELVDQEMDFVPVVEGSEENLFRKFLAHLEPC